MEQESSNAQRYRKLLKRAAEGICLWYPSKTATIGSVGYLRDGRFVELFNAFSPPFGLPGLSEVTGLPDIENEMLPNINLVWMSRAESGCALHVGVPVDPTLVNIGFTAHSQTADAAFLMPGGKYRRVMTLFGDRQLGRYLTNNYKAITERYFNHQIGTLMILRGTTHSNGYCRGPLQQSHRAAEGTLTLNPLGLEIFSLEMGFNRSVINQWLIQAVPASVLHEPDSTCTHCIIIKPVLLRKRDQLLRRLGSTFSVFVQDPAQSKLTAGSPSKSLAQHEIAGITTNASASSSTMVATDVLDDYGLDDDDMDGDQDADELSLSESVDPPDDFEALLDAVLVAHPDVDEIIADWDMLHSFLQDNGSSEGYDGLSFNLDDLEVASVGRRVQLCGISRLEEPGGDNHMIHRVNLDVIQPVVHQLQGTVHRGYVKLIMPLIGAHCNVVRTVWKVVIRALPPAASRSDSENSDKSTHRHPAQSKSSPHEHSALLSLGPDQRSNGPSRANTRLPPTPSSIGVHAPLLGRRRSPCPAPNALCNHGAYAMPRDGQNVHASVLGNAFVQVYGLKHYFAYLLAYGAFFVITKGKSFTLDLDELCVAPITHSAAMVPKQQGNQTDGRPSHLLVNQMLKRSHLRDPNKIELDNFAIWRTAREQECSDMLRLQKYIAAGKLALILQVFGHKPDNFMISRHGLYNFLVHERLPDEWLPNRSKPLRQIGLASTIHVGHHVRRSVAKLTSRHYFPYYVWVTVILSVVTGVLFTMHRHDPKHVSSLAQPEHGLIPAQDAAILG